MADEPYKLALVGDVSVGKTSLLVKIATGKFPEQTQTLTVDCESIELTINGTKVKFELWDTAGQEKFRTMTNSFYRGVDGIVLVYDVSNQESFDALPHWLSDIKKFSSEDLDVVLVGNKCDLFHSKQVDSLHAESYAKSAGMSFFETSALNDVNVEEPFCCIGELLLKHKPLNKNAPNQKKHQAVFLADTGSRKKEKTGCTLL